MQRENTIRIANCSGFYGDRLSAAREMVEGGEIDVLTGDYLAELTLMILAKDRRRDPATGYAKTFLHQLREVASTCLDRGVRIVVNAGGLNPRGCAEACRAVYAELGLTATVGHIEGDDLLPRLEELRQAGEELAHQETGEPLASLQASQPAATLVGVNAYLGAWGIVEALERGADLVICPRVTDASLVVGAAAWHFGWDPEDWNALAGATVAGHLLECGAHVTGGNYAFFDEIHSLNQVGFPLAELEASGDCVITKHPGTGGQVTVGTVTAQLLYEIQGASYLGPDVTTDFSSVQLAEAGEDRVRVSGATGSPPPPTTKVCVNYLGGYRNSVTFLLNGLEVERKAAIVEDAFWRSLGGKSAFDETRATLFRATSEEPLDSSYSQLRLAAKSRDRAKVGRAFSAAAVELALSSYPGLNLTAPPGSGAPFGVYWPALVASSQLTQTVVVGGESTLVTTRRRAEAGVEREAAETPGAEEAGAMNAASTAHVSAPLGLLYGARSGDKGGHANLGIWARSPAAYAWLCQRVTAAYLRELLPEARALEIERSDLPNLLAVNFVLKGFLGEGVSSSLATDPQAKGLGEWFRSRVVSLPQELVAAASS